MQILHAGRYAYHYFPVSASAVKSPIGWGRVPKALSHTEVIETIVRIYSALQTIPHIYYTHIRILAVCSLDVYNTPFIHHTHAIIHNILCHYILSYMCTWI